MDLWNKSLVVILVSLSASGCLDKDDDNDRSNQEEIEYHQRFEATWESQCVSADKRGLMSGDLNLADNLNYKVETIEANDGNVIQTIDYFEDSDCSNFQDRVETQAQYNVTSFSEENYQLTENSYVLVNEIAFTIDCGANCNVTTTEAYRVTSVNREGVVSRYIDTYIPASPYVIEGISYTAE